jgi:hypothetical protein
MPVRHGVIAAGDDYGRGEYTTVGGSSSRLAGGPVGAPDDPAANVFDSDVVTPSAHS